MNIATKRGVRVECAVCGRTKTPRGRDAGMYVGNAYCDRDCAGYYEAPHVGSLWPGETDADFGYPCGDDGTKAIPLAEQAAVAFVGFVTALSMDGHEALEYRASATVEVGRP